jgi:predicted transcriptional regulator
MPPLRMMRFGARIKRALRVRQELRVREDMATRLTDRILEILRGCPYGLTAKEVAGRLDATAGNISSRLSKLAAYGIITKTRGRIEHDASPLAIYSCAVYDAPNASSAVAPAK